MSARTFLRSYSFLPIFAVFAVIPLLDFVLPREYGFSELLQPIFIFAVLGLGLNIVTGYAGMLNLGASGFMALGAYAYAISTSDVFPFQVGFFAACGIGMAAGGTAGVLLALPTMRLSGDYLAIVTLGFGEIVQSLLRNLETITRGTQGINPLKTPELFGYAFSSAVYQPWYYLFLFILLVAVILTHHLEHSRIGRAWIAVREDELASKCMGLLAARSKVLALCIGSAFCGLAGALWASYLGSSGEPGNYDFQISITALCIVIVGGMGSIRGVLLGAVIMVGFNSIVLVKISEFLVRQGFITGNSVFFSPSNWKYLIFGLALVIVMRVRPQGLFGGTRVSG